MSYANQLRELQEKQLLPVDGEESAFNKLLGYNIAAAREKKGLLQKQLAEMLKVSQSAWSRMERGEMRLNVYDLVTVARVLGRRVQDLLPS